MMAAYLPLGPMTASHASGPRTVCACAAAVSACSIATLLCHGTGGVWGMALCCSKGCAAG